MKLSNYNEVLRARLDAIAKERGLASGRDLIADIAESNLPKLLDKAMRKARR